jgi:putative endonuclease
MLFPWLSKQTRGQRAEQLAANYLKQQGLTPVIQNFSCRFGEIDNIMLDHETLVFIEVRYRQSQAYGLAAETIGYKKISRILTTAQSFLQQHEQYRHHNCRFDVISMHGDLEKPEIDWIKQAFTA